MVEVVGFGQACVDYIAPSPFFPPENGKVRLKELYIKCGGPIATALVTLSRLGIKTAYIGAVSDDQFGRMIIENFRKEGVDTSHTKVIRGYRSQFAFISVTDGKRTIFWIPGSFPEIRAEEIDLSPFPHAKVLHLDELLIDASIEAARQARKKGMIVTIDADSLKDGIERLFQLVDIIIIPETLALLLEPKKGIEDILRRLRLFGAMHVVITCGERGSIGYDGRKIVYQKAYEVKVVDTTGAGDVYHGAYIYGILKGWDMKRCMEFASLCSALNCKRFGAQGGIPKRDDPEIRSFIQS